ncbi:cystathionine beta-lyase [Corticibacter populi]|uniref:Cystathionine beta-lyase n=1 Tax=Corticibacter populi TaxID=1550736 RepID=A0A3M6QVZ3_9BURK|nr:PLP-dependent transferase [Corticibacter populi]RMX06682.1 cystathionine beta-lyase [Corticibacter populi]RZS31742.1 cystathionine beta-lyase [Corticibacter populi]
MTDSTPINMPVAWNTATRLIHHPYQPPEGFESPATAVHKGSTIFFPSMAAVRNRDWAFKTTYTYGLHGTPTSFILEERLASLEGAQHCLLVPSGLAAISTVNLALLRQGDEVLLPDNVYGPNKSLVEQGLRHYGITHACYDPLDVEDLRRKIGPRTRLVWLEAAGSVSMEFPDLPALAAVCREHGIAAALDNTWGAGLAFQPFALGRQADGQPLGVDISIHALTKYPSGGGDVLMGSIATCDERLHKAIKLCHMRLGLGVGMNDVEAILRNLPSLALRYHAQDRAARQLAGFLQQHRAVAQVLHPALPGSPGHAHWQRLCAPKGPEDQGACAGIFSFVPDASWSQDRIDAFCEALQLFRIGYSWGGPTSLVMAYDLQTERQVPASLARLQGTRLVRLCIGLEHPDDLQADLAQAFQTVGA